MSYGRTVSLGPWLRGWDLSLRWLPTQVCPPPPSLPGTLLSRAALAWAGPLAQLYALLWVPVFLTRISQVIVAYISLHHYFWAIPAPRNLQCLCFTVPFSSLLGVRGRHALHACPWLMAHFSWASLCWHSFLHLDPPTAHLLGALSSLPSPGWPGSTLPSLQAASLLQEASPTSACLYCTSSNSHEHQSLFNPTTDKCLQLLIGKDNYTRLYCALHYCAS